jgi:hypothetical protein
VQGSPDECLLRMPLPKCMPLASLSPNGYGACYYYYYYYYYYYHYYYYYYDYYYDY